MYRLVQGYISYILTNIGLNLILQLCVCVCVFFFFFFNSKKCKNEVFMTALCLFLFGPFRGEDPKGVWETENGLQ
jgi:hypothetical protein